MKKEIMIHCDGAYRMSKKVGGYGIVMEYDGIIKEFYGYEINSTSQRMELLACIVSLLKLKRTDIPVTVVSDSQYLVMGVNEWVVGWIENGWENKKGETILNQDLWRQLIELCFKFHVKFVHVKGHTGNVGNECADELANVAMNEYLNLIKSEEE